MNENTLSKMNQLKLYGMQRTLESLIETRTYQHLTHDEYIAMLVQSEWKTGKTGGSSERSEPPTSGIMPALKRSILPKIEIWTKINFFGLRTASFIDRQENIIVSGPTGVGKSQLIIGVGTPGCLKGYKVLYFNSQKLFAMLRVAKADGSYPREITRSRKPICLSWMISDFRSLMPNPGWSC